jgi:hypothetical protein
MMATQKSDVLAPALVLPDQFFAEFAKRPGIDSERRLMLAVLEDAVQCYQRYALARDARGQHEFEEARRWVESHEREWPYSFENICDVLGLDIDYIREGLRRQGPRSARVQRARVRPSIMPLDAPKRLEELNVLEIEKERRQSAFMDEAAA